MISKSYHLEKNINIPNKNIFLFYGENNGLKNYFKKKIKNNSEKIKTIFFFQQEILNNKEIFYNEILNISLFEDKKNFIVNDANDKILPTIEEILTKIDNNKIYLFAENLEKKSKLRIFFEKGKNIIVVPCYADNEISIKNIILDKLKNYKGVSTQVVNMISENSYLDRDKLDNELSKIIAYFKNKEIRTQELQELLNLEVNDSFNLLKDNAFNGNKVKTNKLISSTVLEPEKYLFYLNLINQRLSKLSDIRKMMIIHNLEAALNNIKPPIFWKDKPVISLQAKKWTTIKIDKIMNNTYNLEINFKTNNALNRQALFKKLLIDICNEANA